MPIGNNTMRTDDGYIIYQCLNGDSEAFGVLVDKYKEGIYAYTYAKLQNWQDAQDVTQETFIQAYRKLNTLKRWDSFGSWLYRIASNLCKNWHLKASRRPDGDFFEDQNPAIIDEPSIKSYQEKEMVESVHDALSSLSETYREVLTLYYFGGMDSNRIAEVLGVSPTAIRLRLSRARSQLREEIFNMMSVTYQQQKLRSGFTFRIVEIIKRIKINPISQTKSIPWGVSLVLGMILTIIGLNPHLFTLEFFNPQMDLSIMGESKVLDIGEIPVSVLKIASSPLMSNQQGDNNGINPENMNSFFMAPQAQGGKWVRKADMPTARGQFSGAVVNGKIYAIGGQANGNLLSKVEEYDPIKDKWTEKADMPAKIMNENGAVEINGLIYFIGGWDGNEAISTVLVYNPSNDTWVKKSDIPTARSAYYAGVVNGKIYAIGGGNSTNVLSAVEEYDPATDTWIKKSDMPTAKAWFDGAVVNNKIYIFGGDSTSGADWGPSLNIVEEYDPATDKWTRKSDLPTPRHAPSVVAVDDKIYVIGGFNPAICSVVEIYDPSNDTWSKGEDLRIPICQALGCAVDGKIYIIGGYNGNKILSGVEEYDTGFRQSSVNPQDKISTTWGEKKK